MLEKAANLLTIIGAFIGGLWALYIAIVGRSYESGLTIAVTATSRGFSGGLHVVYLETVLKNTGHRLIRAAKTLSPETIARFDNSVAHPGDLQIRRIRPKDVSPRYVDWWASDTTPAISPDHTSLLDEYEEAGTIDFFMEPAETCQIGSTFLLEEGHYLAKVVFVGERLDASEYWSRILYFSVPSRDVTSTAGDDETT